MSTEAFAPLQYPSFGDPANEAAAEEARTRGYAAGFTAGMREAAKTAAAAEDRRESEHKAALSQLDARTGLAVDILMNAARALEARTVPVLETVDNTLAAAALELAQTVIGVELGTGDASARAALARVLDAETPAPVAVVRLNPVDLSLLDEQTRGTAGVEFVSDPSLARGDAVAEYRDGILDARLSSALDRMRTELTGGTA